MRGISRLLHKARTVLSTGTELGKTVFRSRTRSVRRIAQQLHRVARRKGEAAAEELKQAYAKLLDIAQASRKQAARVREALQEQGNKQAQRIRQQLDHFLPLVDQAIEQAARRVLHGESVPAKEQLLSLHEPHTHVIRRHKAGKPTEFGRKLWLGEVAGGISSAFRLLEDGGGLDHPALPASLEAHQQRFGRPPNLLAGDRGVFSPENEELAQKLKIKQIVLPKTGRVSKERKAHERQGWFRRGFRFRAGIETFFSDQKSRGFQLHRSHLSDPARLTRLLIASCLAYVWLVYLGVCVLRDGWLKRLHRQDRCDLSLFRLGLRLLARCLKDALAIPDGLLVPAVLPAKPVRRTLKHAA